MKIIALYRPVSEHGRVVDEFAREFSRRTAKSIDLIDVDSSEGIRLVQLYDITNYPCILAVTNDGTMQNSWVGTPLPLLDEVSGYSIS